MRRDLLWASIFTFKTFAYLDIQFIKKSRLFYFLPRRQKHMTLNGVEEADEGCQKQRLAMLLELGLELLSSSIPRCLILQSAEITGVNHHACYAKGKLLPGPIPLPVVENILPLRSMNISKSISMEKNKERKI
ncbi:uncharacterized protein [Symphalangus syndactylus]|uniref:uncharacterized protein isoform X4 n=1 Tax=Symphalangus syndactylus TaxID=9590 RepID=UPI0030075EC1